MLCIKGVMSIFTRSNLDTFYRNHELQSKYSINLSWLADLQVQFPQWEPVWWRYDLWKLVVSSILCWSEVYLCQNTFIYFDFSMQGYFQAFVDMSVFRRRLIFYQYHNESLRYYCLLLHKIFNDSVFCTF